MLPNGGIKVKIWKKNLCGSQGPKGSAQFSMLNDVDRATVIDQIAAIVANEKAEWRTRENGEIELRLITGEIFLLGDSAITRIE